MKNFKQLLNHFQAILILTLFASKIYAQKEFPMVYKAEFPVDARYKTINQDRTKVLAGNLKEIAMINSLTGVTLWKINFKEKFNIKKCTGYTYDEALQCVTVKFKGEERDEEKVITLDENTGNELSSSNNKKPIYVRDRSRQKLKTWVSVPSKNSEIELIYTLPKFLGASKPKPVNIQVVCTGTLNWQTSVEGLIVRDLCTAAGFEGYGGDYLDISVVGDKVFVIYEGISVLDLNSGKLLWSTSFDNSEFDFGLFRSVQTLGRAALPLVDKSAVYVADLSKNSHKIKKFDINNGNLIWESEKFDNDLIVPELQFVNGTLMVRFGGVIEKQTYAPGSNNVPESCKSEPKLFGDFMVMALDENSGKLKWSTKSIKDITKDKFGSSISNMLIQGTDIVVCSDKNIFRFEANSGAVKYQVPTNKFKIGEIQTLFLDKANVIGEGTEGISSFNPTSGQLNYSTNTDKNFGTMNFDNAYYVWNGSSFLDRNKFIALDLNTGIILGKIKDTKYPYFSPNGDEFIKFDSKYIWRFKTK